MFAIPGLRLGYLLASGALVEQMKTYKPHWSVNAIALAAGQLCISEEEYMEQTRAIYKEAEAKIIFLFFQEWVPSV